MTQHDAHDAHDLAGLLDDLLPLVHDEPDEPDELRVPAWVTSSVVTHLAALDPGAEDEEVLVAALLAGPVGFGGARFAMLTEHEVTALARIGEAVLKEALCCSGDAGRATRLTITARDAAEAVTTARGLMWWKRPGA